MEWLNILMARLRALFRRESVLRDIEEESRVHVEMETETNIKRGMAPDADGCDRKIAGRGGVDAFDLSVPRGDARRCERAFAPQPPGNERGS